VLRLALPAIALVGLVIGGAAIVPVTSLLSLMLVVGVAIVGYALAYAALGASPFERAAYRSGASAAIRVAAHWRIAAPIRARRSRQAGSS
jgi:hypothetical protein